ncbi:hypothetical protein SAMN05192539_105632 [Paraburkholderia diazotrophica]|uniref:Uncharacterized protein n=2 Tax=Paraburkholderia diazotrophica TaxID=667676 RepID=A0A1H7EEG1_9BURK|nr:hypothetical protein SAMN05192539_105632 [Paraburkholderia diazotrophica]
MSKFFKAAVFVAVSVAASASAFASGYGPAPHYNPIQGASASQQGAAAIVAGAGREATVNENTAAVGGVTDSAIQSGHRVIASDIGSTFKHH